MLACPICKHFPLELYSFKEDEIDRTTDETKPLCELYCGLRKDKVASDAPCDECFKREIVEGILYCNNCGRWYPIIDEIPRMLPDNLRMKRESDLKRELEFLRKHSDKVPHIAKSGKPFNLESGLGSSKVRETTK